MRLFRLRLAMTTFLPFLFLVPLQASDPDLTKQSGQSDTIFDGKRNNVFGIEPLEKPSVETSVDFKSKNLKLDIGVLGLTPDEMILGPSPYAMMSWGKKYKGDKTFFQWKIKGGGLMVTSRYFQPQPSALGQRLNGIWRDANRSTAAIEVDPTSPNAELKSDLLDIYGHFREDEEYVTDFGLIGGALLNFAHRLARVGPFDWQVAATAVVDAYAARSKNIDDKPQLYPNLQTDITNGIIFRPRQRPFGAAILFGNTQNFSPLTQTVIQQYLTYETFKMNAVRFEQAPHFGGSAWARLSNGAFLQAHGWAQLKKMATEQQYRVRLNLPRRDKMFNFRASYEREKGDQIEYLREAFQAGVGYSPNWWLNFGADGFYEKTKFGQYEERLSGAGFAVSGYWDKPKLKRSGETRAYLKMINRRGRSLNSPDASKLQERWNEFIGQAQTDEVGGFILNAGDAPSRLELAKAFCDFAANDPSTGITKESCQEFVLHVPLISFLLEAGQDPEILAGFIARFSRNQYREHVNAAETMMGTLMDHRRLSPTAPLLPRDREAFRMYVTFELIWRVLEDYVPPSYEDRIRRITDYIYFYLLPEQVRDNVSKEAIAQVLHEAIDYSFERALGADGNGAFWQTIRESRQLLPLTVTEGLGARDVSHNSVLNNLKP